MTNPSPFATQSTDPLQRPSAMDVFAMRHAAGGDIIDYVLRLERRIERLEAQLKTH